MGPINRIRAEIVHVGEKDGCLLWRPVIQQRRTRQETAHVHRDHGRWGCGTPPVRRSPAQSILDARPGNPPKSFEATVKDLSSEEILLGDYLPMREAALETIEKAWEEGLRGRLSGF
jgi:hypothetical protein